MLGLDLWFVALFWFLVLFCFEFDCVCWLCVFLVDGLLSGFDVCVCLGVLFFVCDLIGDCVFLIAFYLTF